MTFRELMDKHGYEMMLLDLYDKDGNEINPDETPGEAEVIGYTEESGFWDVQLDW